MKQLKSLPFILLSALAMFAMVTLNSCSKDDDPPANEITDAEGVEIKLTWTLPGSTTPLDDADLDMDVYRGASYFDGSSSSSAFESVFIDAADTDGEYTVEVDFYEYYTTDKNVNFTVTVVGQSVSKSHETSSFFTPSDVDDEINVIKIKKAGNKYTVTKL